MKRVGHGGASALAPANSLASFDAAAGLVDMIEFDVRAFRGELVLAHTLFHARILRCARLGDALRHLGLPRFAGIELNLDLKHGGCEAAVLDELRRHGMADRALLSSQRPEIVDRIRALDATVATGISVGGRMARRSCQWRDWRAQILDGVGRRRWDAVMAHHALVDASLVADVVGRAGELYAWTVHEARTMQRLRVLGLTGIAAADPKLFARAGA
jgi:glycerophosphoryl diester phosphodiesterase